MRDWEYLDLSGQVQGPFSADQLLGWRQDDQVGPDLPTRPVGGDWPFKPLADWPELSSRFTLLWQSVCPLLAQLAEAPAPDCPDERAALGQLRAALDQAVARADELLEPGGWRPIEPDPLPRPPVDQPDLPPQPPAVDPVVDEADGLAEQLAGLGLGDRVQFKLPDRSVRRGVVSGLAGDRVSIVSDGESFPEWPAKAVKRDRKLKFELQTKPSSKSTSRSPSLDSRNSSGPTDRHPAHQIGRSVSPVDRRPVAPRRPRLIVAVDTNELIKVGRGKESLQCAGCEMLLARQVVDELDGLKNNQDSAVAAAARRASKELSKAGRAKADWLLLEDQPASTAANHSRLAPDERVLKCVLDFRQCPSKNKLFPADRVLLATSDKNLQLRAMMQGVEARSLDQVRCEANDRDRCWRAAYSHLMAAQAVESAGWTHGPTEDNK